MPNKIIDEMIVKWCKKNVCKTIFRGGRLYCKTHKSFLFHVYGADSNLVAMKHLCDVGENKFIEKVGWKNWKQMLKIMEKGD